jgi:GNAT superfamily N-acetyltransferase
MSGALQIRPAVIDDVPLIRQFIGELADFANLRHQVVVDDAALREHLFGSRPAAEALLGFVDTEPVAFAVFFQTFSTFLGRPGIFLEDLFVRPAHRGGGHGRALIEHVAREANRRGCGRFEWNVLEWNAPAISFYESLGAQVMPEWRMCRLMGDALARFKA